MPSIQDFKDNQKATESTPPEMSGKTSGSASDKTADKTTDNASSRRRRPGLDAEAQAHAEEMTKEAAEGATVGAESGFRLDFKGSEYLRQRAPKVFELAEVVVDEWKKDGAFDHLPISHPLAGMAAKVTLTKAKQVEKKLEEKGVFALAKIGVAYAKSKIHRQ